MPVNVCLDDKTVDQYVYIQCTCGYKTILVFLHTMHSGVVGGYFITCVVFSLVVTLQQRVANALKDVKSIRASEEHRRSFNFSSGKGKNPKFGKPPPVKRSKKCISTPWTHQFVCIADNEQIKPPTTYLERTSLLEAGLGEKKVSFPNIDCSYEEYRQLLLQEYPKLSQSGGYELMRCCSNSRSLEPIPSVSLMSPRATQNYIGRSKVYIRPVQRSLDMSPVEDDSVKPISVSYYQN